MCFLRALFDLAGWRQCEHVNDSQPASSCRSLTCTLRLYLFDNTLLQYSHWNLPPAIQHKLLDAKKVNIPGRRLTKIDRWFNVTFAISSWRIWTALNGTREAYIQARRLTKIYRQFNVTYAISSWWIWTALNGTRKVHIQARRLTKIDIATYAISSWRIWTSSRDTKKVCIWTRRLTKICRQFNATYVASS